MIELCVLGSGSSGNSYYVGDEESAFLLDAGFSARDTRRRLDEAGLDAGKIRGIVITHDHSDHSKGAGVLSRALKAPVHINEKTYERVKHVIGDPFGINHFCVGASFEVAGFNAASFSIPHDAADPCAFVFSNKGGSAAVVTDAGSTTFLMETRLKEVDYIVLEANHDPSMLMAGPYPWPLKQRIASRMGHLSNDTCMELLKKVIGPKLQGVTFAHLSEKNNNPDLVALGARDALNGNTHIKFDIASQDSPCEIKYVG
ncbi:Zn-dependent hydrolase YycJ/WalJ, required for cell wall metabolism and coordination of cell division with DNA replication [hydrothermal vent metagenome]|uniref:Zn-dependent hydrolase YycJ/WalJ, required for cell wall metabolism and coordination of cell division with DNA replication n=1 Tax=hydrothermal vent metagenome TaxID=652676 RepID=A0A3B1CGP3_9ZZZZ